MVRRLNEEMYDYYNGWEEREGVLWVGLLDLCDLIPGD
jgi:hypothetical protein